MAIRACTVSFADHRGIRHTADVSAESLYEAAVLAVRVFRSDPWIERVGASALLNVEIREPSACHTITLQQVERWLEGATPNPLEATKKAKLKNLLIQR